MQDLRLRRERAQDQAAKDEPNASGGDRILMRPG
jgi:hypothetical protein